MKKVYIYRVCFVPFEGEYTNLKICLSLEEAKRVFDLYTKKLHFGDRLSIYYESIDDERGLVTVKEIAHVVGRD